MAEQIILQDVATLQNSSIVAAINANNTIIEEAFLDVLSLAGTEPNQMVSNLDMNSFQIINLPAPSTINSPARLIDVVSNPTITISTAANTLTGTTLATNVVNSSLTSVGTITSGTWNGTIVNPAHGGTGINNNSNTITIGGNITTDAPLTLMGGVAATFTFSGITAVTFPTSGTLLTDNQTITLSGDVTGTGNTALTTTVQQIAGVSVGTPTGTGNVVFSISPTLTTPVLGIATGTSLSTTAGYVAYSGTATPAAASSTAAFSFGSAGIGIYFGTGTPNAVLTAAQGSLFIRQDGGAATALYLNTSSGSGSTWVAVT